MTRKIRASLSRMHTDLTDAQLERYARHVVLDEVGEEGQLKLLNAKVLVVGAGFVPDILNREVIDEVLGVSNANAFAMARKVAKLEGIPIGISSGAAISAACELGQRPDYAGKRIVIIIPSFAERYLSTALFEGLD